MREKYLDKRFSDYIVLGEYPDGSVGIAENDNDNLVTKISKQEAKDLIDNRDQIKRFLYMINELDPEVVSKAYDKFFYGDEYYNEKYGK